MDKDRKYISHYEVFNFWKDKAIKRDGSIIDINEAGDDDVEIVGDYYEPCCWCCNKYIEKVEELKTDSLERRWTNSHVKSHLNLCHIIPFSKGGTETPDNIFLLCERCHKESPDTIIPKYFFQYIYKKRKDSILGWFKSDVIKMVQEVKELCEINGKDFEYLLNNSDMLSKIINDKLYIGCVHGATVAKSTIEAIICESLPYKRV